MTKTVLTVDDSRTMREIISCTLRDAGYHVIEAEDGEQALRVLGLGTKPDLVITDINMPKMNGFELIRSLRANPDYCTLPILVLTTEADGKRKEHGREIGATGWIVKPFSPEKLAQVVTKVCA